MAFLTWSNLKEGLSAVKDYSKKILTEDLIGESLKSIRQPAVPQPKIDTQLEKQLRSSGYVDVGGKTIVNPSLIKLNKAKEIRSIKEGIATTESKGTGGYNAVGQQTEYGKALGRYQIMPSFHFSRIGLNPNSEADKKKFLNTPLLQEQLVNNIINERLKKYNNDPKKLLAYFYGGDAAVNKLGTQKADVKQANNFPSINEYIKNTLPKIKFIDKKTGLQKDTSVIAPGPTKEALLLSRKGEKYTTSLVPEERKLSPYARAQEIIQRQVDIGKTEPSKLPEPRTVGESFKQIITAPIRYTAGSLAKFAVSTALEKANADLEYIPKREWEELFIGPETVKRLSQDESLYGLTAKWTADKLKNAGIPEQIANKAGLAPAFVLGAIIENPFIAGIGKGGKKLMEKSLKETLEKELGRKLVKEEMLNVAIKATELFNITDKAQREKIAQEFIQGFKGVTKKETVPQVFKTEKIALTPEEDTNLKQLFKDSGLIEREIKSTQEMIDDASTLDVNRILSSNNQLTDAEVIRLKSHISDLNKQMVEQANRGNQDAVDILTGEINQALKRYIKGGTAAGRSVYAYKVLAQQNMEPTFWLNRAKKLLGREDLPGKVITQINEFIKKGEKDNLAQYVANLEKGSWIEKLITLRTAGLLTGIPKTDLKNITSNVILKSLDDIADATFTKGLDLVASLFTKKRTVATKFSDLLESWSEFSAGAKEGWNFLKTGIDNGKWTTEKIPFKQAFNKFSDNPIERNLARYTNLMFKRLEAEDKPFKAMAYAKSMLEQARVEGLNQGLKGKELEKFIDNLITQPTEKMVNDAKEYARYITLQSDNILNDIWKWVGRGAEEIQSTVKNKEFANRIAERIAIEVATLPKLIMNLISPFNRVATNLIIKPLEYSPAGFLKSIWSLGVKDQKGFVKSAGRAMLGTSILAGLYSIFKNKDIKFEIPELSESKKEQQLKYREKKSPYTSITFKGLNGEQYNLRLGGIDPMPKMFLLAGLADKYSKGEIDGNELLSKYIKSLLDETYAKGLSDILDMNFLGGYYSPKDYLAGQAGSFVPTIIYNIAKTFDNNLRLSDGIIQKTMERIPILRGYLPKKYDAFGKEATYYDDPLLRVFNTIISPVEIRKVDINKVDQELEKLYRMGYDVLPNEQAKYIRSADVKIEFTPEELSNIQRLRGQNLWNEMLKLIDSKSYQNATVDEKASQIQGVYRKTLFEAKQNIIADIIRRKDIDETAKVNYLLLNMPQEGVRYYINNEDKINYKNISAEARKNLKKYR